MNMGLILHPGHTKCGSSSIQKYLYDNRTTLEEKGYAVPDRFFHLDLKRAVISPLHHPRAIFCQDLWSG